MAQRTCDIDGCERKHVARGMCGSHYNAARYTPDQRHRRQMVACSVCATMVSRRVESTYAPTCSVACRTIVQWGASVAQVSGYEWRTDVLNRVREHGCELVDRFDRVEIFERDDWTCQQCHVLCDQPDPFNRRAATVDHIVALANGGEHSRRNAQTLCLSCNSAKSDRSTSMRSTA